VVGTQDVMETWQGRLPSDVTVKTSGYNYGSLNGAEGLRQAHFPPGGPDRWEAWLDGVADSSIAANVIRWPASDSRHQYYGI